MKKLKFTFLSLFIGLVLKAQVKDIEGNIYKTTKIGQQEWISENLKVTTFRDGTKITFASNAKEWKEMTEKKIPCWTYYLYDKKYENRGLFYNFYATHSSKHLAPKGWKIPNAEDWNTLVFSVGSYGDAGKKLKSKKSWERGNGTDEYGFTASCYGFLRDCQEFTTDYKTVSYWRIDPEYEKNGQFGVGQSFNEKDKVSFSYSFVGLGMYVRLVKEK